MNLKLPYNLCVWQYQTVPFTNPLKIAFTDIDKGNYSSYGERETYYYFTCPICGARTEVSYSSMPKEFRILLW